MVIKIEQDQLFMFFPFFNIIICEALLYHHHISQSYVHILVKVFLTYTKELMLLPMTFLLGGGGLSVGLRKKNWINLSQMGQLILVTIHLKGSVLDCFPFLIDFRR